MKTAAYGVRAAGAELSPMTIERRDPGPEDVAIDVLFCGLCHSDVHQARDEWGGALFPMVPGHEIVGRVAAVGAKVTKVRRGDLVGVGCMVDSCRTCGPCADHDEQFCEKGCAFTYNGTEMDRTTPTFGGYSKHVVVTERFVLRVPESLDPAGAAPLLCAGITTFAPLRDHGVKAGDRVGVVGLGGLGHMAVKLAAKMGAHVTVLSTSASKEADAKRLGAEGFLVTKDPKALEARRGTFDFVLDTVSADHDIDALLRLLRPRGTLVLVGMSPTPLQIRAGAIVSRNRNLTGSLIGGTARTQEMLDFCAEHGVTSDIELVAAKDLETAYRRMVANDVRYRFVLDTSTL